jgi:hypothetical protein
MAENRTIFERLQAAIEAGMTAFRGGVTTIPPQTQFQFWDGLSQGQRDRIERYKTFWKYYEGDHHKPLKKGAGGVDDNVIINHSRTIVDRGVSFLFGKTIDWQLEEGDTTPAEEDVLAVWGSEEKRMSLLHDVGLNGAVCGTFYIQIMPQEGGLPRLINLNPGIVFPIWNPRDIDDAWAYELRFRAGDAVERTIYSLEADAEGVRLPGQWVFWSERLVKSGMWEVTRDKQEWPWDWPPIVHGKNLPRPNDFYGYSDLEDADLNDAINFTSGNTNRILRLHAHPVLYGYGFGGDELRVDPGMAIIGRNPEAFLNYLEMGSQLQASHDYFKMLDNHYFRITRVPSMDPDNLQLGAQSGFALRVLHGPLLEKTETKRRLYGMALIELNRRLADMLGHGPDNLVDLQWQDPLPVDEQAQNESDRFDHDAELVSRQTLAERRGYIWEREQQLLEMETAAREALQKAQAILALTNAGGSLQGASEVAGLTEEQVGRLLEIDISLNGTGVEQ